MDIFGTYIRDDLIFLFSSIILVIYFFFFTDCTKKEKLFYSFIFILFNSSYNSHFVTVTNNNLVTLRTFLWAYKVIWKFTILDVLTVVYLLFNITHLNKALRDNRPVKVLFVGDILMFVLGTVSYLIFQSYRIDGFSHFIICVKVLFYAFSILIMASNVMKHRINIIYPMFIILFFGFLGIRLTDPQVGIKIRYGIFSVVSDQEDMCTLSLFIVIYLSIYFVTRVMNHKAIVDKKNTLYFIIFLFSAVQFVLCMSKAAFLYYAASVLIFCILYRRKTKKLFFFLLICVPIVVFLFHDVISDMLTSDAINTRFLQVFDFVDYMKEVSAFSQFIGLGYGSPYLSTRETFDPGEIKDIDLGKYGNYKFDVQTPIVSVMKDVGIVGVIIFLINRCKFVSCLSKISRKHSSVERCDEINIENISIIIYLIPISFTLYFFHTSMVATVVFLLFLLVRLNVNIKNVKTNVLR